MPVFHGPLITAVVADSVLVAVIDVFPVAALLAVVREITPGGGTFVPVMPAVAAPLLRPAVDMGGRLYGPLVSADVADSVLAVVIDVFPIAVLLAVVREITPGGGTLVPVMSAVAAPLLRPIVDMGRRLYGPLVPADIADGVLVIVIDVGLPVFDSAAGDAPDPVVGGVAAPVR